LPPPRGENGCLSMVYRPLKVHHLLTLQLLGRNHRLVEEIALRSRIGKATLGISTYTFVRGPPCRAFEVRGRSLVWPHRGPHMCMSGRVVGHASFLVNRMRGASLRHAVGLDVQGSILPSGSLVLRRRVAGDVVHSLRPCPPEPSLISSSDGGGPQGAVAVTRKGVQIRLGGIPPGHLPRS